MASPLPLKQTTEVMKRPNTLDWIVYRVFRWWWNPILRKDPSLLAKLRLDMSYRDLVTALADAYRDIVEESK